MTIDSRSLFSDSPSFAIANHFWVLAKEEFYSDNIFQQKDGCEKAFRAATEVIDTFLSSRDIIINTGQAIAHQQRSDALEDLPELESELRPLNYQYSAYKDKLHGICFYGSSDPMKYKKLFDSVGDFIKSIERLTNS